MPHGVKVRQRAGHAAVLLVLLVPGASSPLWGQHPGTPEGSCSEVLGSAIPVERWTPPLYGTLPLADTLRQLIDSISPRANRLVFRLEPDPTDRSPPGIPYHPGENLARALAGLEHRATDTDAVRDSLAMILPYFFDNPLILVASQRMELISAYSIHRYPAGPMTQLAGDLRASLRARGDAFRIVEGYPPDSGIVIAEFRGMCQMIGWASGAIAESGATLGDRAVLTDEGANFLADRLWWIGDHPSPVARWAPCKSLLTCARSDSTIVAWIHKRFPLAEY